MITMATTCELMYVSGFVDVRYLIGVQRVHCFHGKSEVYSIIAQLHTFL